MSLLLKKGGARGHSHPALKKRSPAHEAKASPPAAAKGPWTPLMEERRQGGPSPQEGRREVDRAKEPRDDGDGGPDA